MLHFPFVFRHLKSFATDNFNVGMLVFSSPSHIMGFASIISDTMPRGPREGLDIVTVMKLPCYRILGELRYPCADEAG